MRQRNPVRRWLPAVAAALMLASLPLRGESELVFEPAPALRDLTAQQLLDIAVAGERLVAVGASGLVITSDDGGDNWEQARVPVSATLTAVDFPTPQQGWAVGHAGVILHSSDGGLSWNLQFDGNRANDAYLTYSRSFRDDLQARVDAMSSDEAADAMMLEELEYALEDAIFAVEDAELAIETGPADPFLDVRFFDAKRGLAVGAYGMLYGTEDGGGTWLLQLDGIDNPDRFHLYSIHTAGDSRVFLAGEAGLLYSSDDGGRNFRRYEDVYDGSLFGALPLGDRVLTFGLRGNLFVQEPDGDSWQVLASDNSSSLYGGGALRDGGVVLVGAGGSIMQLAADGGAKHYQHPARSTLSSALQAPDGRIWLVGMEGLASLEEAREQ